MIVLVILLYEFSAGIKSLLLSLRLIHITAGSMECFFRELLLVLNTNKEDKAVDSYLEKNNVISSLFFGEEQSLVVAIALILCCSFAIHYPLGTRACWRAIIFLSQIHEYFMHFLSFQMNVKLNLKC